MGGAAPAPEDAARIVLRPIGTPIALGLAALLMGTTMLSGLQLDWLRAATDQRTVGIVAVAAAFPLQILAASFAFLARDTLTGTGLGIFSTIWGVSGLSLLTGTPGGTSDALGMFQIVGAIALALLILSAGRGRLVFGMILLCGCVRLGLSGLYEIKGTTGLSRAAGWAGLVLGAASCYGIVALLMEDLPGRALLPVGRSGRAARSVSGTLADQLEAIENEPGVRRTL